VIDQVLRALVRTVRASWLVLPFVSGCGGSLNGPVLVEHPRDSYIEVPYPPPAALAETVPDRPEIPNLVWLDGDWTFRGKAYAWRRGGWFIAPAGARYAPSKISYLNDGRLLFAPAAWYDARYQILPRMRAASPAQTPPNEVTSELQTAR
jgi:hypothetical protein